MDFFLFFFSFKENEIQRITYNKQNSCDKSNGMTL